MGLDGVELILAVEDSFRIQIPDEEASKVATVGDLYELVISKLQGRDSKRCLTSAAFYRTRRGMVDALGIERRQIKPATPLASILPEPRRREDWRRIEDAIKFTLPPLRRPMRTLVVQLAIGAALTLGLGIYQRAGVGALMVLFFVGLVAGALLAVLTPGLAVAFPRHNATVGDLARDVLALNHARLAADIGTWNKNDAWEALCRVIELQMGVSRDKIRPEAHIVGDLGID